LYAHLPPTPFINFTDIFRTFARLCCQPTKLRRSLLRHSTYRWKRAISCILATFAALPAALPTQPRHAPLAPAAGLPHHWRHTALSACYLLLLRSAGGYHLLQLAVVRFYLRRFYAWDSTIRCNCALFCAALLRAAERLCMQDAHGRWTTRSGKFNGGWHCISRPELPAEHGCARLRASTVASAPASCFLNTRLDLLDELALLLRRHSLFRSCTLSAPPPRHPGRVWISFIPSLPAALRAWTRFGTSAFSAPLPAFRRRLFKTTHAHSLDFGAATQPFQHASSRSLDCGITGWRA